MTKLAYCFHTLRNKSSSRALFNAAAPDVAGVCFHVVSAQSLPHPPWDGACCGCWVGFLGVWGYTKLDELEVVARGCDGEAPKLSPLNEFDNEYGCFPVNVGVELDGDE